MAQEVNFSAKTKSGSKINVSCPVTVQDNNKYTGVLIKAICLLQVMNYLENSKNGSIRFFWNSRSYTLQYV